MGQRQPSPSDLDRTKTRIRTKTKWKKGRSTLSFGWLCGWRVPAVQHPVNCGTTEMIVKVYPKVCLIEDELVMMGMRPRAFSYLLRRMSATGVHLLPQSLNGGAWISITVILLIWLLEQAVSSSQKLSLLASRIKWSDFIWTISDQNFKILTQIIVTEKYFYNGKYFAKAMPLLCLFN